MQNNRNPAAASAGSLPEAERKGRQSDRRSRARMAWEQGTLLHDGGEVAKAYDRMVSEITRDLGDADPVVLSVMIGGLVPTAELIRRFEFPFELDYLHATRYQGETAGAELKWRVRPGIDLRDRSVLVVDDILDEGYTLESVMGFLTAARACNVMSAVLVEKHQSRRVPTVKPDYVGFETPDRYLFGCGMDYLGYLRQVSGIHAVPDSLL